MALLPFINPTISETEYFGGIDNTRKQNLTSVLILKFLKMYTPDPI